MNTLNNIPHVSNETGRLRAVVLGLPQDGGKIPLLEETYDAKSYESVATKTYPTQSAIDLEMSTLLAVLERYRVDVFRPTNIPGVNQIFARDVAFVIEDLLFVSNIIQDRAQELEAFQPIFNQIHPQHVVRMPNKVRVEGGDVVLYNDIVFVGQSPEGAFGLFKTSRTNQYALDLLKDFFPHKDIIPVPLIKHDQDPYRSVLHLDCAFQPVGTDKAILYPSGLVDKNQVGLFYEIFGKDNLFEVSSQEAYHMGTNFVSLSPQVVIIEAGGTRLKEHLEKEWGMTVETVPYKEISKQGGLLRCSTCPIIRD